MEGRSPTPSGGSNYTTRKERDTKDESGRDDQKEGQDAWAACVYNDDSTTSAFTEDEFFVDDGVHRGAPLPRNEEIRLETLRKLYPLDPACEESCDEITALLSKIFQVPIVLVSLVDQDKQWFPSKVGLKASETDRDLSFCAHSLLPETPEVLYVPDATLDPRFKNNALVVEEPHIRFYLGAPLIHQGIRLGSLCLIDTVPRRDVSKHHAMLLVNFADVVSAVIGKCRLQREQFGLDDSATFLLEMPEENPSSWYVLYASGIGKRVLDQVKILKGCNSSNSSGSHSDRLQSQSLSSDTDNDSKGGSQNQLTREEYERIKKEADSRPKTYEDRTTLVQKHSSFASSKSSTEEDQQGNQTIFFTDLVTNLSTDFNRSTIHDKKSCFMVFGDLFFDESIGVQCLFHPANSQVWKPLSALSTCYPYLDESDESPMTNTRRPSAGGINSDLNRTSPEGDRLRELKRAQERKEYEEKNPQSKVTNPRVFVVLRPHLKKTNSSGTNASIVSEDKHSISAETNVAASSNEAGVASSSGGAHNLHASDNNSCVSSTTKLSKIGEVLLSNHSYNNSSAKKGFDLTAVPRLRTISEFDNFITRSGVRTVLFSSLSCSACDRYNQLFAAGSVRAENMRKAAEQKKAGEAVTSTGAATSPVGGILTGLSNSSLVPGKSRESMSSRITSAAAEVYFAVVLVDNPDSYELAVRELGKNFFTPSYAIYSSCGEEVVTGVNHSFHEFRSNLRKVSRGEVITKDTSIRGGQPTSKSNSAISKLAAKEESENNAVKKGNSTNAGDADTTKNGNSTNAGDADTAKNGNSTNAGDADTAKNGNSTNAGDADTAKNGNSTNAGDADTAKNGNSTNVGDADTAKDGDTLKTVPSADGKTADHGKTTDGSATEVMSAPSNSNSKDTSNNDTPNTPNPPVLLVNTLTGDPNSKTDEKDGTPNASEGRDPNLQPGANSRAEADLDADINAHKSNQTGVVSDDPRPNESPRTAPSLSPGFKRQELASRESLKREGVDHVLDLLATERVFSNSLLSLMTSLEKMNAKTSEEKVNLLQAKLHHLNAERRTLISKRSKNLQSLDEDCISDYQDVGPDSKFILSNTMEAVQYDRALPPYAFRGSIKNALVEILRPRKTLVFGGRRAASLPKGMTQCGIDVSRADIRAEIPTSGRKGRPLAVVDVADGLSALQAEYRFRQVSDALPPDGVYAIISSDEEVIDVILFFAEVCGWKQIDMVQDRCFWITILLKTSAECDFLAAQWEHQVLSAVQKYSEDRQGACPPPGED